MYNHEPRDYRCPFCRNLTTEASDLPHSAGTVSARHVILALPPSLAVQTIEFEPAMPDGVRALAAATPVWMGTVAKAVMVYAAAFWRHQGLAGAAISHIGPLRELHDMSGADGGPAAS